MCLSKFQCESGHEALQVLEGFCLPENFIGAAQGQVNGAHIPDFDNKHRQHTDAGTVQKLQLPQVNSELSCMVNGTEQNVHHGLIFFHTIEPQKARQANGGSVFVILHSVIVSCYFHGQSFSGQGYYRVVYLGAIALLLHSQSHQNIDLDHFCLFTKRLEAPTKPRTIVVHHSHNSHARTIGSGRGFFQLLEIKVF